MLMKVAEKFNFNINTFTHILEGYKVADKMKAHGAGGSTFSDWWAYKYEVNDAIPYNAAIMHNNGVLTAINSDDAEMARRLNQEAAKSIKYGGVSDEDALKFVTLNPAKLLHIDDKVGSIKIGKDADLVIWSDHPLSVYAKAEKTIIEGTVYFDLETHEKLKCSPDCSSFFPYFLSLLFFSTFSPYLHFSFFSQQPYFFPPQDHNEYIPFEIKWLKPSFNIITLSVNDSTR